ncbi:hypothetical protein HQI60_13920 [Escherichia coli]|uniref:hypothetical protein n=1 Tax=Escherichia coli TaxID=562 RepID=UPI001891534C|nr:hypothetical protein [Escherichia coli]
MLYATTTRNNLCSFKENGQGGDTLPVFLCTENPQLGWGFRKASSFEPVIKTPFDLLKHLAVWQLQVSNKKSKGGPNGERKELSAHPMEL